MHKKSFAFIAELMSCTYMYWRMTRAKDLNKAVDSGQLEGIFKENNILSDLGFESSDIASHASSAPPWLFNDYYFEYLGLKEARLPATYTDGLFYASADELIQRARVIFERHSPSDITRCLNLMDATLNNQHSLDLAAELIKPSEISGDTALRFIRGYKASLAKMTIDIAGYEIIKQWGVEASMIHAVSAMHCISKSVMREETFIKDGLLEKPPFDQCDGIRWVLAAEDLMQASESIIMAETLWQQEEEQRQKVAQASYGAIGARQNDMRYEPLRKEFISWYLDNRCRFDSDSNAYRNFLIGVYAKLPEDQQILKPNANHKKTLGDWKRAHISDNKKNQSV
jgi:hypothetical protein